MERARVAHCTARDGPDWRGSALDRKLLERVVEGSSYVWKSFPLLTDDEAGYFQFVGELPSSWEAGTSFAGQERLLEGFKLTAVLGYLL